MTVGVLTVDTEESFRRAARSVVAATPGFEPVAEATSAEEAIEVAVVVRPRLVLLAVALPGIDGFETSQRLTEAVPEAVVVLVHDGREPDAERLTTSGAALALGKEALTPASLRAFWDKHQEV
jgi:DNA-binding NarL/FixJ family response regulator